MAGNKRKSRKWLYVVLLVVLLALIAVGIQFSVFQKRDVTMIQYAGIIPEDWDRPDIVKSSTVRFDGYEISTKKVSSGCTYSDWYCASNTCKGAEVNQDENDCILWENPKYLRATINSGSSHVYPYTAIKESSIKGDNVKCKVDTGGIILACKSGYQKVQGRNVNMYVYTSRSCGGLTRDEESCGPGCFAKFTIKKDGATLYESDDYVKTENVFLFPVGVRQQAVLKTLCKYEDSEGYMPCIYEEGEQKGEYAPLSYCENKYGKATQCDDVLVDDYVTQNMFSYSKGDDVYINSKLLKIQFNYDSLYSKGDCRRIENTFQYIVPNDAFDFEVTVPEGKVVQGEDIKVEITIMNTWQPVKGNLTVYFEIPTDLKTPSTETKTKIIDIPQGESTHTYTIPTGKATELLKVKPTLYVLLEGSMFQGVNGKCFGQTDNKVRDLHQCEYVEIGKVTDDTHEINIVPYTDELEKELQTQINAVKAYEGENAELEAQVSDILQQMDELELSGQQQEQYISELTTAIEESGHDAEDFPDLSDSSDKSYLYAGIGVGAVILLGVLVLTWRLTNKKKRRKYVKKK